MKRTSAAAFEDGKQSDSSTREDTVKTVCKVLKDGCKVDAEPSDIQSAVRLYSKAKGPRPLLVTFHSTSLPSSVVRARRPKLTLTYDGASTYINDHLTRYNTDLFYKLDCSSNKRWRTLLGYEMDAFLSHGQSIRDPIKYSVPQI